MVFVLKESKDVFASEAKALGKEHWVNEKDVNNCYCCNDIFSITLRKHHWYGLLLKRNITYLYLAGYVVILFVIHAL